MIIFDELIMRDDEAHVCWRRSLMELVLVGKVAKLLGVKVLFIGR